jgi:carboxypeptidase C (cathepsin A)
MIRWPWAFGLLALALAASLPAQQNPAPAPRPAPPAAQSPEPGPGQAPASSGAGDFFDYNPRVRPGASIASIPTVGPPVVTHHQITLAGKTLSYTARVGMMPIANATTGVVEGYLNYTYYSEDGVADPTTRPVSYCFNGGPGAGTLWLHLGAFGPERIQLQPEGRAVPPYTYAPNPDTLLDQTDLVFVDAMGTGWSRPTKPQYGPNFWGVKNDIAAFGEFVRSFTNQYNRWGSPIFLVGESYGTTRAAGLSGYLTDHDMPVQGVFLLSTVINSQAGEGDLGAVNALPTQAMTAWYHHKVAPNLQKLNADQMSQAAVEFASTDYLSALYAGARMTPEQRAKTLNELHQFTGLPVDFLAQNDLKVSLDQFSTELLRSQHEMTSRLDSRFDGYLPNGGSQTTPFDFSLANAENAFLTAYERYMRNELHYVNNDIYYALGGGIGRWTGSYDTASDLTEAFAKNPGMKLMVAMGYYDFATPYGAVEWTLAHLKVSPQIRKNNIMVGHYQAGHMVYLDRAAADTMRADLRRFYTGALASVPGVALR